MPLPANTINTIISIGRHNFERPTLKFVFTISFLFFELIQFQRRAENYIIRR